MTGGVHQIDLIDADGSGNRKLIDSEIGLNHHSWAPDGNGLAAVGYVDHDTWSIFTFSVEGTDLARLTTTEGVWDSDPAWAPDEATISFTRVYPGSGYREELWLMDSDGGHQRALGVEGSGAQWSPDGTSLCFESDRSINEHWEVYTMDVDGSNVTRVTHLPSRATAINPVWRP
jgi:Tol biopolymer transport system component